MSIHRHIVNWFLLTASLTGNQSSEKASHKKKLLIRMLPTLPTLANAQSIRG
jgi:hypothetical protein